MNRILYAFVICLIFISANSAFASNGNAYSSNKKTKFQVINKIKPCTIKVFRSIKRRTSMKEVVRLCGEPSADIGSGIHIYVYKLPGGSEVRIGTPDDKQIMYIAHVAPNGKKRNLLKNK